MAMACSARETGLRGKGGLVALALMTFFDTQASGEDRWLQEQFTASAGGRNERGSSCTEDR